LAAGGLAAGEFTVYKRAGGTSPTPNLSKNVMKFNGLGTLGFGFNLPRNWQGFPL
jgi:hypothetical protein